MVGQGMAWQVRAGHGRAWHGMAWQGRVGHGMAGQEQSDSIEVQIVLCYCNEQQMECAGGLTHPHR